MHLLLIKLYNEFPALHPDLVFPSSPHLFSAVLFSSYCLGENSFAKFPYSPILHTPYYSMLVVRCPRTKPRRTAVLDHAILASACFALYFGFVFSCCSCINSPGLLFCFLTVFWGDILFVYHVSICLLSRVRLTRLLWHYLKCTFRFFFVSDGWEY